MAEPPDTGSRRRVDLKGWLIAAILIVPCIVVLRVATVHLASQVALDAGQHEALYAEILFRQNQIEHERMSQRDGAPASGLAREMLIKSTTVKRTAAHLVGRVEILIFRDPPTRDRYVHYFRLHWAQAAGWMVDWDVQARNYYFGD
ncbi:MAG: hypothetical protein O2923_06650 [Verrucomicrobia bacterium]|nr:hypothetical protein [Verrucomicrobiota bacterium]MDA1088058.1 hypothetical protein [Verrucomicrobiota bacterium]